MLMLHFLCDLGIPVQASLLETDQWVGIPTFTASQTPALLSWSCLQQIGYKDYWIPLLCGLFPLPSFSLTPAFRGLLRGTGIWVLPWSQTVSFLGPACWCWCCQGLNPDPEHLGSVTQHPANPLRVNLIPQPETTFILCNCLTSRLSFQMSLYTRDSSLRWVGQPWATAHCL